MAGHSIIREVLEKADAAAFRRHWSDIFPHLADKGPKTNTEAEISLHMARTQSEWLDDRKRCYSHAWLIERKLPSQLPDNLKAKADRLYPRVVEGVFVSANSNSPLIKPIAKLAQAAMCDAVEDAYANGDTEPAFVRSRIQDARKRTFRKFLGV